MANKLIVRCSCLSRLMTGFVNEETVQGYRDEVKSLIDERDTLINKNGNKVKWTPTKEEKLNKLILKSSGTHLSDTTKSYVREVANFDFFGIQKELSDKKLEKGIRCEQDGIDLRNLVEFTDNEKSDAFGDNGWLTGHPDQLIGEDEVDDIKIPWSFDTFPMLQKQMDDYVIKGGYEWQLRGYFMLFNRKKGRVVACLVDTPDDLLTDWDNESIHKVSHIEPKKRVSYSKTFYRDLEIEKNIKTQYDRANEYYKEVINELNNK